MPYCIPRNRTATGLAEISRRLSHLTRCLEVQINAGVVEGDIVKDLRTWESTLLAKLEGEGWSFSYDAGQRLKVRPPGHPHPFPKRNQ
jgi:hypothetical protein